MRRKTWVVAAIVGVMALGLFYAKAIPRPGRTYDEVGLVQRFSSVPEVSGIAPAETDVLLTPDTPLKPGRNALWCASVVAGWQEMMRAGGGPVRVEGAEGLCAKLNAYPAITPELPPGGYYSVSGVYSAVWAQQVRSAVAQRTEGAIDAIFPGAVTGLPISYSCLYVRLRFPKPYFDWDSVLDFRGVPVRGFGIEEKHQYAYYELRQQIQVLYRKGMLTPDEFAIDLNRNSVGNQLILAKMEKGVSLQETWARLQREITSFEASEDANYYGRLGPNDLVGVPNINFDLWHEFSEVSGRPTLSPPPGGLPVRIMQQIRLRLDRSGMELSSQTPHPMAPVPSYYVLTSPYLLVAKRRGPDHEPYLMLWIETPELLQRTSK